MIEDLLLRATLAGIRLSVRDGVLYLSGDRPAGGTLKADLVKHKQELIEVLSRPREGRRHADPAPAQDRDPEQVTAGPDTTPPKGKPAYGWTASGTRPPLAIRANQRRRLASEVLMGRRSADDW